MKKNRLPLFKYICILCVVMFIGCNIILHKDLFEAQKEIIFGTDSFNKKYAEARLTESFQIGNLWIEVPLGFLQQNLKLHRRLLGSGHNANITQSNTNRRSVNLHLPEMSGLLLETSQCGTISFNATKDNFIASGWTKVVYKGKIKGQDVAVKTVNQDGFKSRDCATGSLKDTSRCFLESAAKILREISILQNIQHPNIVQLLGHCTQVKANNIVRDVLLATELGQPVDLIKFLQMSWEDRLRVSYGLSKLLTFLAHSPFGSIVLNDFRREQFILVDGDIKLTDMDDVGFQEPKCTRDKDCSVFFSSSNFTLRTKCYQNSCKNYNERLNIYNTGRHFTTFLLPHGCPQNLKATVGSLVMSFSNASMGSSELLARMDSVVQQYSTGLYLNRAHTARTSAYKEFPASDLPGMHDYGCRYSIGTVCSLSVFDAQEAEDMCDKDTSCAGFVLSSQATWTGRILAIFKSSFSTPSFNAETRLYVKPGFVT